MLHTLDPIAIFVMAAVVNAALPSLAAVLVTEWWARRRGWNAASRYLGSWLMFVFILTVPVLLAMRPRPESPSAGPVAVSARSLLALPPSTSAARLSPVQPVRYFNSAKGAAARHQTATELASPSSGALDTATVLRGFLETQSLAGLLLLVWVAAAGVQLMRISYGLFTSLRLKKEALCANSQTDQVFHRAARAINGRRRAELRISDRIASPAVVGYFKPYVLMPASLIEHLDPEQLHQVLSHELAHVARWDDWALLAQRVLQAICIVHPLAYFIGRRLDLHREAACDDRVIASCRPETYAECLTRVAELREIGFGGRMMPALFEHKAELITRVELLLDRTRAHMPRISMPRLLMLSAGLAGAAIVSLHVPALLATPLPQPRALKIASSTRPIVDPPGPPTQPESSPVPPKPPTHPLSHVNGRNEIIFTAPDGKTTTFSNNGSNWDDEGAYDPGTIIFRSNGKQYVIRDKPTIAAVEKLMQPMQELERQQEELGRQQEKLGEEQEKLGQQQEKFANRKLDANVQMNIAGQLRRLEQQLKSLDLENKLQTANEAQERIAELQSKLEETQALLGEEQGKWGREQGLLGEQQGKLGQQQGRLGEQQGKLGEQQGREAERIRKDLQDLIKRAQQQGLAQEYH